MGRCSDVGMESCPIPKEQHDRLIQRARFYEGSWILTVSDVMGICGCGDSRGKRYRAIILAELEGKYRASVNANNGSG